MNHTIYAAPPTEPDKLGWRILLITAVLGFPLLFGVYFCFAHLVSTGDIRFLMSLLGESLALGTGAASVYLSLRWLRVHAYMRPSRVHEHFVNAVSLYYVLMIAITALNADAVGLFSKGGRLDFYFENDWYRRLVTFSYVPLAIATFLSLHAMLSPHLAGRRAVYAFNLFLLFLASLMWGSKGAALLSIASALGFVFSMRKLPVMRIGLLIGLATAVYVAFFLLFTTDRYITLLGIVQRFYLSIDMSILLQDRATSELLVDTLGDVWTEVFRNLSAFGVRVSDAPIGALIYDYALSAPESTGANCRYGSLLLLYPERVDFLIGYPLLVVGTGYMLREFLVAVRLDWAAMVALPLFVFQSFQDVYWYSSHLAPVIFLFGFAQIARAIRREAIGHPSNA